MDSCKKAETVDEIECHTDWRDSVNIGIQYGGHRKDILHKLPEFRQMWDGHLCGTDMAKDSIKLSSQKVHLINSVPIHSQLRANELKNSEMDKTIRR